MDELLKLEKYVYREGLPRTDAGFIDGHITVDYPVRNKTIRAKGHIILMQECDESVVESELGSIFLMYGATKKSSFLAGMNVYVKHAENAVITAQNDIVIEDSVRSSQLSAGRKIISEANRGRVIGGRIEAGSKIELSVLGSPAEMDTAICIKNESGILVFKNLFPGVSVSIRGKAKALKFLQIKGGVFKKVFLDDNHLYIASVTREVRDDEVRYVPAGKAQLLVDE